MNIVSLYSENVKRLKAVTITPDGAVQIVAGRNAQGKSSVLDSIWMALEWKAAGKVTKRPIRDGEDTAKVVLHLGDLVVTRRWAGTSTSLLVEAADGTPQQRPQELLDSLIGELSFDPLAFTQKNDRDQVSTLLGMVTLPFDPDELDAQRQALYDRRHLVGQDVSKAKGALESMPTPDPDLPATEIITSDLLNQYQAIQDIITHHNDARRDLQDAAKGWEDAVRDLRAAQDRADAAGLARTAAKDAVDALGQVPDLGPIKADLADAEAKNVAIRAAQGFHSKKAELKGYKAQWADLDAQMDALDERKAKALAAATFPIEGLSFGDGCVTYNGIPFSQSSSAEQLKVSLALAMAMNPTLRVIRIMDGSLLDTENLAIIERLATDHDFQVWIERVDESGTAGVVIEDGRVV